jgi:hypothetical protein
MKHNVHYNIIVVAVGQANVHTKNYYLRENITKAEKKNVQPRDGFTAFSFRHVQVE